MSNWIKKKFIKYHLGGGKIRAHIDAVHAHPSESDEFTGNIVEGVVSKINCPGIIAIVSRTIADLNKPRDNKNEEAIDEYRQTIKEIMVHIDNFDESGQLLKPYLHLAIHGMKDKWNRDVEIGTLHGKSCSAEVKDWFVIQIKKHVKNLIIDEKFSGDESKLVHRHGDQNSDLNYIGYGVDFNTFQIEISRTLRENYKNELIEIFSNIILKFNKKFK